MVSGALAGAGVGGRVCRLRGAQRLACCVAPVERGRRGRPGRLDVALGRRLALGSSAGTGCSVEPQTGQG